MLSLLSLPPETLPLILDWLRDDDASLLRAEETCTAFREAISGRSNLWKSKGKRALHRQRNRFGHTPKVQGFEEGETKEPGWYKAFYFKTKRLPDQWRTDFNSGKPKVVSVDCLEAQDPEGRKVCVSTLWQKTHNYRGVYDTVWDQERGRITASVFNTIQVWDVGGDGRGGTPKCLALFDSEILDSDGLRSTCFHASGDLLACGTQNGVLRLFHLINGKEFGQFRNGHQYISDLKVYGEDLLAIDWYGEIQEWKVKRGGGNDSKLVFIESWTPPAKGIEEGPDLLEDYRRRHWERLLDFNENLIVTNCEASVCLFSRQGESLTEVFVSTEAEILCCKAWGKHAYWGEQQGKVFKIPLGSTSRAADSSDEEVSCFKTRFGDNITSIDVNNENIVIGDVNGDIHCLKTSSFGQEGCCKFLLENYGHAHGSFVWSVHVDASRIFSGDSDSKLVIHDFWDYESDEGIWEETKEIEKNS